MVYISITNLHFGVYTILYSFIIAADADCVRSLNIS